ncbi:MAG: peptidoglycan bridge formation glycyltransferase FemA/FemB family protein [Clostridia bacterium]|nr:peptidoglycan bridge formation glycyltransferase FemA/FemB family protein [Clostridia bacterium]
MENIELEQYYEFLEKNPRCHFLQSPEWAKVKSGWKSRVVTVKNTSGEIEGSLSLLIRKIPIINKCIIYAPRGPICDITNKKILGKLIEQVRDVAKEEKAFIFRWDPDVLMSNEEFKSIVIENGVKLKKNINHDITKVIQPKYETELNIKDKTEDELLSGFSQKTRYNIRLAMKKGVIVEEGTEDDIEEFFSILTTTSQRDDFSIRNAAYYKKIYEVMKEKDHVKLYFAVYNNKRVASTFEIIYGNKAWYLYGGSLREHSNVMPNYLLQWEMIKYAMQRGCEYYNFGGVSGYVDENAHGYGVYRFKKGFNPEFKEYIDELYIIFKPVTNALFNLANKLRKLKK